MSKVTGSKNYVDGKIPEKEIIYGKDTVYVHTEIAKMEEFPFMVEEDTSSFPLEVQEALEGQEKSVLDLYAYEEEQFSYPEWAVVQDEYITSLKSDLENTELALMEIFEGVM